jgi:hypothetical protein
MIATGGNVTDVEIGGRLFRVHSFTDVGSHTFEVVDQGDSNGEVDVLVVAGGGSGAATPGEHKGGAGGAGGLVFVPSLKLNVDSQYSVAIGKGGDSVGQTSSFSPLPGIAGENSTFGELITALGGGRGARRGVASSSLDGGSGGGGHYQTAGGQGLQPSQPGLSGAPYGFGNQGGSGGADHGRGGGGAGDFGRNSSQGTLDGRLQSGAWSGGIGLKEVTIGRNTYNFAEVFGTEFGEIVNGEAWFAGGGGGGENNQGHNRYGAGGLGGGGRGAFLNAGYVGTVWGTDTSAGESGDPNTGGGGGSARQGVSGAGGSGIVIIRYPLEPASE